ncbi:MAG: FUSC family protein [Propionicimonas sp.]
MVALSAGWVIPRRTLVLALTVSTALLVPLALALVFVGASAALGLGLGFSSLVVPALRLKPLQASALSVPSALTGVVAAGLQGSALPAAAFVALTCLLVVPATVVDARVLAGIPSAAAVFVAVPLPLEPARVGLFMILGGALAVALLGRSPRRAQLAPVPPVRAWTHGSVMAVAVGISLFLVIHFGVPHGYWVALTLTVVLRPFQDETWRAAAERVLGTFLGVLLSLVLAALLPRWALLLAVWVAVVLMAAYAVQGDYVKQVAFMTPAAVLIGSGGSPVAMASDRVVMTLLGVLVAAGIALGLSWFDRWRAAQQTREELG